MRDCSCQRRPFAPYSRALATVHHIAFYCHDIYAQEKFYARHFGFKRVWTFNEGQENEFLMLRSGPTCLEFFPKQKGTPADQRGGEQKIGLPPSGL